MHVKGTLALSIALFPRTSRDFIVLLQVHLIVARSRRSIDASSHQHHNAAMAFHAKQSVKMNWLLLLIGPD
jgi:hypothetical protein